MTKVNFVKSARKEYKDSFTGEIIKAGESYYWWAFRFQPRKISKTPPKPSQLTQSEFLQAIYGIQEEIDSMKTDAMILGQLDTIKEEIESLRDETEDKLNNVPDNLQNSQTAELLQSRVDSLQEWIDNLEGIDIGIDEELNKDEKEGRYKEILEEIQSQSYEGE
jgi:molecular chaperone DnaK (HSP70)